VGSAFRRLCKPATYIISESIAKSGRAPPTLINCARGYIIKDASQRAAANWIKINDSTFTVGAPSKLASFWESLHALRCWHTHKKWLGRRVACKRGGRGLIEGCAVAEPTHPLTLFSFKASAQLSVAKLFSKLLLWKQARRYTRKWLFEIQSGNFARSAKVLMKPTKEIKIRFFGVFTKLHRPCHFP